MTLGPLIALVFFTAVKTKDAEPLRPRASAQVLTRVLSQKEVYHLNISNKSVLQLHLPVRCDTVVYNPSLIDGTIVKGHANDVTLKAVDGVRYGTPTDVNILCADGVRVSLRLTVAPLEDVAPRVEFELEGEAVGLFHTRLAEERTRLENQCESRIQRLQRNAHRVEMQTILSGAQQAFGEATHHESARAGSVIVYVDRQRRLGNLGIIEFRIVNRERGPVAVKELQVSGVGSQQQPAAVGFLDGMESSGEDFSATGSEGSEGADVQGKGAVAILPTALLQAGVSLDSAIAFPWPDDTTRFALDVRVRVDDAERVVHVKAVDFDF